MPSFSKVVFLLLFSIVFYGCDNRTIVHDDYSSQWADHIKLAKVHFTPAENLELITWYDYFPQDVLDLFTETYGVVVKPTFIKSNEDMFNLLQTNPTQYDVIVSSDYMISKLIKSNLLHKLDHDNIKNIELLSEDVRRLEYDKGLIYTIPLFRDSLGIAFNIKNVSGLPRKWHFLSDQIRNEYLAFRVGVRKEMRIALGVSLMLRGYSPNSVNPEEILEARDFLIHSIKTFGVELLGPESRDQMIANDILLGLVWSGNAAYALHYNSNVRFLLPEEDVIVSYENITIIAKSTKTKTAELFINFLLTPKVTARLTNFNYTANCNPSSSPFINEIILNGPSFVFPKENDRVFLKDLGEEISLYEEAWEKVLQAKPSETLIKLPLPKRGGFAVQMPATNQFSPNSSAEKNEKP